MTGLTDLGRAFARLHAGFVVYEMVPPRPIYSFDARYYGDSPAYEEFDAFIRTEMLTRPPGWEPTFGRVRRINRALRTAEYGYLLTGDVPEAKSHAEAEKKARRFVHDLGKRFKMAHANPGCDLPEPVIRVWQY